MNTFLCSYIQKKVYYNFFVIRKKKTFPYWWQSEVKQREDLTNFVLWNQTEKSSYYSANSSHRFIRNNEIKQCWNGILENMCFKN